MRYRLAITGFLLLLVCISCDKKWEQYYNDVPETVDMNVWDAIQQDENLSTFVQFVKQYKYDTLFLKDNIYSLFIPDNDAFAAFLTSDTLSRSLLNYEFSLHFVQSRNISGKRKVQTLAEKFALFNNTGSELYFDDVLIDFESPLYTNGKYFIIGQVAEPKPNLYEYIALNNPVLKSYIDSQDSIVLDKELSIPIGFDEHGNTIYDSVTITYNLFELEYFPVSEEFRNNTATIVFPKEEDYNAALDEMASVMNGVYTDHSDIPMEWQHEILIPYLLERSVFENMLEPEAFIKPARLDTLKLKNILGDSVAIDYTPIEKTICSNGYAYNYYNFHVPDTLLNGTYRLEGESLLRENGVNAYTWREGVEVLADVAFVPYREYIDIASNDSILRVLFTKNYSGAYSVEFKVPNLFPRKYLMVVRTNMYVGGLYEVYLNDELAATMNWYNYFLDPYFVSVTGTKIYKPTKAFNRWDCWLNNTAEYGTARIRFEYKGPANVSTNGLSIDYIDFIPYDN
ncbi:MAG: fasciclin domain-containing protein [Bacteroidota bacterium]